MPSEGGLEVGEGLARGKVLGGDQGLFKLEGSEVSSLYLAREPLGAVTSSPSNPVPCPLTVRPQRSDWSGRWGGASLTHAFPGLGTGMTRLGAQTPAPGGGWGQGQSLPPPPWLSLLPVRSWSLGTGVGEGPACSPPPPPRTAGAGRGPAAPGWICSPCALGTPAGKTEALPSVPPRWRGWAWRGGCPGREVKGGRGLARERLCPAQPPAQPPLLLSTWLSRPV